MGDETETHTSEESDYELQQSISSASDCEEVTLKCCKRKKLFSANEIWQILNLCKEFVDREMVTEHRLQKALDSISLFDKFTYSQIRTWIAYEHSKNSKCQR